MHIGNEQTPHVSFGDRNTLHVNGRIFETPDMAPEQIRTIIEAYEIDILRRFIQLHRQAESWLHTNEIRTRPAILIARLALHSQPSVALTPSALTSKQHFFTDYEALTLDAMPYWRSASATNYLPQVQFVRLPTVEESGVWLGISEQN